MSNMCRVGFFFKPTQEEKHYLVNLRAQQYHTTWSGDASLAMNFSIEEVAEAIENVRVKLKQENFGREEIFDFCRFVEFDHGMTRRYFWE